MSLPGTVSLPIPGGRRAGSSEQAFFSVSRNPLYLGGIIALLGLALALNVLWVLVALLVSIVLCHYILIVPEEQYLAAKFGQEYEDYLSAVHRWFGRK